MLKPFIKWPGGKSRELNIIKNYLPAKINNYFEPFLGGGAHFFSLVPTRYNQAFLNDLSVELIALYQYVQSKNKVFFKYLKDLNDFWVYAGFLAIVNNKSIDGLYQQYWQGLLKEEELEKSIDELIKGQINNIQSALPKSLDLDLEIMLLELKNSIYSKLLTIRSNEIKKGALPREDYQGNFATGIRAGVYNYYRYLYNYRQVFRMPDELHIALFFYLREFCFSSMFRYNKKGEFNVPYGGKSYNEKDFQNKIEYLTSPDLSEALSRAKFSAFDFQEFFVGAELEENDFVFLDPPYDTTFSTYANQTFGAVDHGRLADYLLHNCNARFLLIIKNTDFIYNLYQKDGIQIIDFAKEYQVNFLERNKKQTEHLLIKNY